MAQVSLMIGDRRHVVACRDGEEDQLGRLGAMIDARWPTAVRAAGNGGSERAMLLVALMLADEIADASGSAPAVATDDATLLRLAERLERLAEALEDEAATA